MLNIADRPCLKASKYKTEKASCCQPNKVTSSKMHATMKELLIVLPLISYTKSLNINFLKYKA